MSPSTGGCIVQHEQSFLQPMQERPDDNALRLVYADWLEERDDPRADFVRVECTFNALEPADEQYGLTLANLNASGRLADPSWLALVSRFSQEQSRLWNFVSSRFSSASPPVSTDQLRSSWDEAVSNLRNTFARYAGKELTANRFSVPADYAVFMVTAGGRKSSDEDWLEILDAASVATATEADCSNFSDERGTRPEDPGLWMTIGYHGDLHPHLLCCDREHPLFGMVVEGEDSHPWLNSIQAMTGISPSFLGYLRDYLTRRVQDQLRAFPTFSVSKWLDCEKAGRGRAWTLPGAVAELDGRDYIGHIRPPSPLPGPRQRGKPEVVQPLSREQVERVLAGIGSEAAEYVSYDPRGFLTSNWSAAPYKLWPLLYRFSETAADATGGVILNDWHFPVYRAGQNAFP